MSAQGASGRSSVWSIRLAILGAEFGISAIKSVAFRVVWNFHHTTADRVSASVSKAALLKFVVLFEHLLQPLVRKCNHAVIVDAGHSFRGDQRIYDGLLGGLHGGLE